MLRFRAFTLAAFLGTVAGLGIPDVLAQAEATGSATGVKAGAGDARSTTRAELQSAAKLVDAVKGLRGPARTEALTKAAAAYQQVIDRHPDDRGSCARAWFEIGELERRKANLAAAEKAYAQAVALDAERFGARALIEQAHMQRRLDRPDEALAAYRKVATLQPDSGRAHTARLWIARCLKAKGDLTGAIASYESALDTTTHPGRSIELLNGLAKACLAQGDLDGAGAALARADKLVPEGDGKEAQRLRKAVEKMSARKAWQRARDKANGAHEDARKLEREMGRKGQGEGFAVPLAPYFVPIP
jgi:tetratricopeptide (TPR) repeat protein